VRVALTLVSGGAAVAGFAACGVLGRTLGRPWPLAIDVRATALRGRHVALAAFFTALGRWWAIVLVTAVAAAGCVELRGDLHPLAFVFVSQLGAQALVTGLKCLYRRVRPAGWLRRKEADLSFPSGHATTAVVFYGGLLVWVSHLKVPFTLASVVTVALGACCIGIPWSRLALGAHYATDVLGGLCLGTGWSCALVAIGAQCAFASEQVRVLRP